MKFDTIIIGGGLSGLLCGIKLQEQGHRSCILSAGQSTLQLNPGVLEILGRANGKTVEAPFKEAMTLSASHPYQKIGTAHMSRLAEEAKSIMKRAGIKMQGETEKNHYRVSPTGNLCASWQSQEDALTLALDGKLKEKVMIANIQGYGDFPASFIAAGLEEQGANCEIKTISLPELEEQRKNATEMRSINIGRILSDASVLERFGAALKAASTGNEMIVIPAVLGLKREGQVKTLESITGKKVRSIATLPPSLPGVKMQQQLRRHYQELGGMYLQGEKAIGASMEGAQVIGIKGERQGDIEFKADNYVLASGSFVSHGLISDRENIYEPVFGADVESGESRSEWYNPELFGDQPYMRYGVKTDKDLKLQKDGKPLENVWCAGWILSGADRIKEGSMSGISALSGLRVAELITEK